MTCACALCAASRALWNAVAADVAAGIDHPCRHGHTGYCGPCDAALDVDGGDYDIPTAREERDMDRAYEDRMVRAGLW